MVNAQKHLQNKHMKQFLNKTEKTLMSLETKEKKEAWIHLIKKSLCPSSEWETEIYDLLSNVLDSNTYTAGINGAIMKSEGYDDFHFNVKDIGHYGLHDDYGFLFHDLRVTYFGEQEKGEKLWNISYDYLKNKKLKSAFIDMKEYYVNDFSLFRLIEEADQFDIIFLKNLNLGMLCFLLDFGLPLKTDYLYFFINEEDKSTIRNYISEEFPVEITYQSIDLPYLYKKKGKVGFDLYDNYSEWKKQKDAPTRNSPEYRKMKHRVRKRDNYTCQCCGYHNTKKHNHNLEVHHIYGYNDHLDYRVEDDNCIVLCRDCHKKYHAIYGRKYVNPSTFSKFIRDYNRYYVNDSVQLTLNESIKSNI